MKVLAVATLILLSACSRPEDDAAEHAGHGATGPIERQGPPVVEVTPSAAAALSIATVMPRQGASAVHRRAPASASWDPLRSSRVTTQVGGQVRELHVPRPGEALAKGQVVARLYSPELRGLFAELLVARDLGEPWLAATRSRVEASGVLAADVDAAVASGRIPDTFAVRASNGGIVVSRTSIGTWLAPGGVIAMLADPASVVVDVVAGSAALIVGLPVSVSDPTSGERWTASVETLLPTAEAAGWIARLRTDGTPPIGRPLVAEWDESGGDGLWIPRSALVDTGERRVVFVAVGEGRFESRAVEVGLRTATEVQVLSGLAADEAVVSAGTFLLDSETQVMGPGHASHGANTKEAP